MKHFPKVFCLASKTFFEANYPANVLISVLQHFHFATKSLVWKANRNFSQFINMMGTRYSLKTAMIYGGNGLEGHWRSLIKETVGFGLYSDAHQPKHITSSTALNRALSRSTDVIYVQSSAGDTREVEIENPAE